MGSSEADDGSYTSLMGKRSRDSFESDDWHTDGIGRKWTKPEGGAGHA